MKITHTTRPNSDGALKCPSRKPLADRPRDGGVGEPSLSYVPWTVGGASETGISMPRLLCAAIALLAILLTLSAHAQTSPTPPLPLTYTTSWIGNSFGGEVVPGLPYHKHVQISADDVFVAGDGTVYTDTGWDENGYEAGFYRDGDVRGALEELSHGWGRSSGGAVTANNKYVFAAITQNGDDGADKKLNRNGLRRYPDPRNAWVCVRRFTHDGRSAPFPTGMGWKNDMVLVNTLTQNSQGHYADEPVSGLAASAGRLYVSDPTHAQIRVYDAETLASLAPVPCERPGKLALGTAGRLWVLQSGDGPGRNILCLDSRTGARQHITVTGPANWDPQGIAADQLGHVFVADSGPDQNVKIYAIKTSPRAQTTLTTFGVKGGVFAAPAGVVGTRRFNKPLGVGTDRRGNLYVYSRGSVSGGGSVIESYAPSGKQNWRLLGLEFIDCAEPDPASEGDVYTKEEHFAMDYVRPAGQQWSYKGYTVNRLKYPDDPRLHTEPTSAFVRRIGGKLFLYTTDMYSGELSVSRFDPKTDGECAIPCVHFAKSHVKGGWPAGQPAQGEWLWRDTNGDGRMAAGEFTGPDTNKDAPSLWGWSVDSRGTVWQATDRDGLRVFPCAGLDSHGVPLYSYATMKTSPMPAPFTELCRIEYAPETDTLWLTGYTRDHSHAGGEWGTVGTEIVRYDAWSRGAAKPALRIVLPYDGKKDAQVYVKAMSVAGGYVFAVESRDPERVFVYDARTGALQGTMQPDETVGKSSGWVDTPYGIRAFQRASGEYLVFVEEDLDAKVLLYRWTPPGATAQARR